MVRTVAPAARALVLLSLLVGASAWMGSTLSVSGPGSTDRSPVLVFTPNVRTSAKLPVVLLLHGRCQNALGADAYFHFANLVDQARAPAVLHRAACVGMHGCGARCTFRGLHVPVCSSRAH
jgi:poly(3-hydroxybutyrate) depolymerase